MVLRLITSNLMIELMNVRWEDKDKGSIVVRFAQHSQLNELLA